MVKKFYYSLLILVISFFSSGCWNYVGLNNLIIVTGFSIDKSSDNQDYLLTFEIVNLKASSSKGEIKSRTINSKGKTIFDAVSNAQKKSANRLYFGNAQIIIISEKVAQDEGIQSIIDFLLREEEIRETVDIVISKENSANELFTTEGINYSAISYEIEEILLLDNKKVASTIDIDLYRIYNILKKNFHSLVLPAFHLTNKDENRVVETAGIAIFNKDKLFDYLTPEQTKYLLLIINKIQGGILTVNTTNQEKDNITLEIKKCKTKNSYVYDNNFKFMINITCEVALVEDNNKNSFYTDKQIQYIEKKAETKINNETAKFINMVQSKYSLDIFRFGNLIYQKNPKLWKKVENNWKNIFKNLEFEVDSKININNTATTK